MLKKILIIFAMLLCPMATPSFAAGDIGIEFVFTPPANKTVTGYKVHRDGSLICTTLDTSPGLLNCAVPADLEVKASWTITAVYSDASESSPSPGFFFPAADLVKHGHQAGKPFLLRVNGAVFRLLVEP